MRKREKCGGQWRGWERTKDDGKVGGRVCESCIRETINNDNVWDECGTRERDVRRKTQKYDVWRTETERNAESRENTGTRRGQIGRSVE